MKAILSLETFGDDLRQEMKLFRKVFALYGETDAFDQTIGVPPASSWAAEIVGPDPKYRLARRFLRGNVDYSHANGNGSRGVRKEFILESGHIYEVRSQETWSHFSRYFCTVSEDGEVIKIDEETACHSVGAETSAERRERIRAERVSRYKRA